MNMEIITVLLTSFAWLILVFFFRLLFIIHVLNCTFLSFTLQTDTFSVAQSMQVK